jgi:cytochrome c-type biogenesis protein CcmH/NrfG
MQLLIENIGYAYRKLNRYSDSLMAYQDSLRTDPDSANAQYKRRLALQ